MCWGKSYGQIVDRGSITWLQNNISFSRDQITKPGGKNSTRIFICKEQVDSINMNSKKLFCHQIVSYVQWEQEGVVIENDIYKHGRVREKYTYRIPYKAIVSGSLSNCQPNKFGFVTAYHERPIFIKVRRNTIEVGHARYDMNGICHPVLYRTNSDDTDWETTIPIAGNWDDRQHLSEKLMGILNDIAEKNRTKLVIR
jgi:hypothetical protein